MKEQIQSSAYPLEGQEIAVRNSQIKGDLTAEIVLYQTRRLDKTGNHLWLVVTYLLKPTLISGTLRMFYPDVNKPAFEKVQKNEPLTLVKTKLVMPEVFGDDCFAVGLVTSTTGVLYRSHGFDMDDYRRFGLKSLINPNGSRLQ